MQEETDYYIIEGGYLVFTREYHLKRGYCCKNGCRHCPWRQVSDRDDNKNKIEEKRL
jgi:hypothetical protein